MALKIAPWLIALLTLALGLLFPWLKTPLIIALSYGLSALGVSILIRAGQVSFGHAGFTCMAGYAVGGAFLSLSYYDLPYNILVLVVLGCRWMDGKEWVKEAAQKQSELAAGSARNARLAAVR